MGNEHGQHAAFDPNSTRRLPWRRDRCRAFVFGWGNGLSVDVAEARGPALANESVEIFFEFIRWPARRCTVNACPCSMARRHKSLGMCRRLPRLAQQSCRVGKIVRGTVAAWAIRAFTPVFAGLWGACTILPTRAIEQRAFAHPTLAVRIIDEITCVTGLPAPSATCAKRPPAAAARCPTRRRGRYDRRRRRRCRGGAKCSSPRD